MRTPRLDLYLLALGAVLAAAPAPAPLAAQEDEDRWLRRCQREARYDDRDCYCEVRHLGFHSKGGLLTIDPDENGGVEIYGWDADSVAVSARIQVNANSQDDGAALARDIKIVAGEGSIRVDGPTVGRHHGWGVILVLRVPRKSDLRAETTNGPLAVSEVTGTMDLRAQNGPVSLERVAGDVRVRLQNGPLNVELDGTRWSGKGLDAEAVNGPVDLAIPSGYNAELETGTVNGPTDFRMPVTVTLKGRDRARIRTTLGQGGAPIRVVTTNGPFTLRKAGGG